MNDTDKLVKTEIKGRQVTYYLTTEEDLNNIKSNGVLGDIFAVLTSLAIGGIISVLLTKATGVELQAETLKVLNILLLGSIVLTIIFGIFTGYFYFKSFETIKKIKESGVVESLKSVDESKTGRSELSDKKEINKKQLEILAATYFTDKKSLDVTEELRRSVIDNKIDLFASNDLKHDPDPGSPKKLNIKYNFNGVTVTKQFKEGHNVVIP